LTFNVSNLALQNNSTLLGGILQTAPQDAFEVALTNANTGANLMNGLLADLGANHSDALLNIQLGVCAAEIRSSPNGAQALLAYANKLPALPA
jgi:hypothetical protein